MLVIFFVRLFQKTRMKEVNDLFAQVDERRKVRSGMKTENSLFLKIRTFKSKESKKYKTYISLKCWNSPHYL